MVHSMRKEVTFPRHVIEVKKYLSLETKHPQAEVASKLIADDPELVKMWISLEKHGPQPDGNYDNLWVWMFLSAATTASSRPRYELLAKKARQSLIESIDELANELSRKLVESDLNYHLIYGNGLNFPGFRVYEDFSESNQDRIDDEGIPKLSIATQLLPRLKDRCRERIQSSNVTGKAGKEVEIVRFVRSLVSHNMLVFGKPLNTVVAVAANAVYGTAKYGPSDISNLMRR